MHSWCHSLVYNLRFTPKNNHKMIVEEITAYCKDFMRDGEIQTEKSMYRYFVRVRLEDGKVVFQFYSPTLNIPFIQSRNLTIKSEFEANITREKEQDVKSFWFVEWDNPPNTAENDLPKAELERERNSMYKLYLFEFI